MPKITNVTVERGSPHADYAVMCEFKGARYHVWADDSVTHEVQPTLFKNPPLDCEGRDDPRYFSTRRLDATKPKNREMIEAMMREAKERGLFSQADERLRQAESDRRAQNEAAYKVTLAEKAGPKMLNVLRAIAEFWKDEQSNFPLSPGAHITEIDETILDAVREAVAEAEGVE